MKLEIELAGTKREVEFDEEAGVFRIEVGGRIIEGSVARPEPGAFTFFVGNRVADSRVSKLSSLDLFRVTLGGTSREIRVVDRKHRAAGHDGSVEGRQTLVAPMPGKIVEVMVGESESVTLGQGLVVVEAMKMQNEVKSPKDGVVTEVRVAAGDTVTAGQVLVVIE